MVGFYIRLEVRLMLACPNEQRIKSTSCIEQMYWLKWGMRAGVLHVWNSGSCDQDQWERRNIDKFSSGWCVLHSTEMRKKSKRDRWEARHESDFPDIIMLCCVRHFLQGCQWSNELFLILTGSIQAVCASLHHISNILSDQVGELINKALRMKSRKHLYIFLIYSSFMQVLSFVQGELAQVPEDSFTDILGKDSKVRIHAFLIFWCMRFQFLNFLFIPYRRKNSGVHGRRRWITPKSFLKTSTFSNATFRCAFTLLRFQLFRFICSHLILNYFLRFHPGASTFAVRHTRRPGTYFTLLEWNSGALHSNSIFLASQPFITRFFHTDQLLPLSYQDTSQPFEHCSHNSLRSFASSSLQLVDNTLTLLSSTSFELDDQENHGSLDSWVHHLLTEVDQVRTCLPLFFLEACRLEFDCWASFLFFSFVVCSELT